MLQMQTVAQIKNGGDDVLPEKQISILSRENKLDLIYFLEILVKSQSEQEQSPGCKDSAYLIVL